MIKTDPTYTEHEVSKSYARAKISRSASLIREKDMQSSNMNYRLVAKTELPRQLNACS